MSISKKVLTIFIVTAILSILSSVLISHFVINKSFQEIENDKIEEDLDLASKNLTDQIEYLNTTNDDWASWDDTYVFIEDANEKYIESNLPDETLSSLNIDFMVYVDASGEIVYIKTIRYSYQKSIDQFLILEADLPDDIYQYMGKDGILNSHNNTDSNISGLLILSNKVLLVSSEPILTSKDMGPIKGSLIMGRYLENDDLEEIFNIASSSVNIYNLKDPLGKGDFYEKTSMLEGNNNLLIERSGNDLISGYKIIKDIFNEPVLLVEIESPRQIYKQGLRIEILDTLLLFVILLTLAFLTYLLIKKTVIERLINLSNEVKYIGKRNDLRKRITFKGKDELVDLTKDINSMLDELEQVQNRLKQSEERYRSLFEHSLDGIYLSTIDGRYLDANQALIDMLGYDNKTELLSVNIPRQLYWNEKDRPSIENRNKIFETILRTKSGRRAFVEISSKVLYDRENKPYYLGVVRDITLRKKTEEKIHFLSFHDDLTGLYNRAFFEEELNRLNTQRSLPMTIVIGDVNGLKLINDAFGHMQGDKLLRSCAEIFKKCMRKDDIVARWGGDEFIILLPNTDDENASLLIERIREKCKSKRINNIPISISLGMHTKVISGEKISVVIKEAEDAMYRRKLLERKSISSSIISSLERTLWERSNESERHSERIREMSMKLGRHLKLSQNILDKIALLATLHDLGKVAIPESILKKKGKLNNKELQILKRHPEIGFNIAHSSVQLMPIADGILTHHEKWDGSGYPQGLKGKEIPLISRIIAILDAYDVMTNDRPYGKAMTKSQAIQELKNNSGIMFDPELVKSFLNIIMED